MKLRDFLYIALMGFGLGSCAYEAPFSQETKLDGEGKFLAHSLKVDVKTAEALVRAGSDTPDVNDFTVAFFNTEKNNGKYEKKYKYNELPEVVTLPVGSYVVKASYGGDTNEPFAKPSKPAGFSAPYYLGVSQTFQIENNKIIDDLDPVVCKLANVKVTINFDTSLLEQSEEPKVSVTVGNSDGLLFYPSTKESGYFAYVEGSSTLAATFTGTVEGEYTVETKTYTDIKPGTHYSITFKLHTIDKNEPGYVNPGDEGEEIKVDAVVNLEDMTGDGGENLTPEEEEKDWYLKDDRYPEDEPSIPVVPDDPDSDKAPSIVAQSPVDLDNVNSGSSLTSCVINIHSYAEDGISSFECDIKSNSLTPDELASVGLASHLDLVNTPESLAESLQGLGFPINVGGNKDVKIDISSFMPLLGALGSGQHDFVLTVGDANGETTKTLSIQF